MKKSKFFKWISSIICISFLSGLSLYIANTNSKNNSFENILSLDLNSNVKKEIDDYSFQADQLNNNEWQKPRFDGHVLDKAAIAALGWDTKPTITLDDWKQAPNVTKISDETINSAEHAPFGDSTTIISIEIPKRITMIGGFAFFNSSLANITFENESQLNSIGEQAFFSTSISSISIPNSVMEIGTSAFHSDPRFGDPLLGEVTFESNSKLETIGELAFAHSIIQSIHIPDSVKSIGPRAFESTSRLKNISMPFHLKISSEPQYGFSQEQWNSIVWRPLQFSGTILTKDDVINIGWDKKTSITLADWQAYAPNVTQLGTSENLIEKGPFSNNDILQSIEIPDSVLNINNFSFYNNQSLTNIIFGPNSQLSNIGNSAFEGSGITSINIPNSVITIGTDAFKNTSALPGNQVSAMVALRQDSSSPRYGFTQVQWDEIDWIPILEITGNILTKNDVIKLGWHRKSTISLEDWKQAPNVTQIGETKPADLTQSAFSSNTILQSIQIPSRITKINLGSFNLASSLRTVNFEQGSQLLEIGNQVFEGSGITSINIPNSVTTMGENAFKNTSSLKGDQVSILSTLRQNSFSPLYGFTQEQWDAIAWRPVIFLGDTLTKNDVINIAWNRKTTITLEDWATWAPNVVQIGATKPDDLSQSPFSNNDILQSITIPNKVQSINFGSFYSSSLQTITFATGSQLSNIGNRAFEGSRITSIDIPNSVITIGENAFWDTESTLQGSNVVMPISLIKDSLPLYGFTKNQWDEISQLKIFKGSILNKEAVEAMEWDTKETITLDDWKNWAPNVTQLGTSENLIEKGPFSNNDILKSIEIPDSVLNINNFSFYNNQSLTNISFGPNSQLSNIGSKSFFQSGIETLIIPKLVSSIGNSAFENSKLSSISFQSGSKLEVIGENAFNNSSIQLIEIPSSLKTIKKSAFENTKELATIKFDENSSQLTTIGLNAFLGSSITSIDIPKSVFSIEENAFKNTTSLKSIKLSYNLFLSSGKNSLEPLFGFTEEQWFSINWLDVPTGGTKINSIISRSLLKIDNDVRWSEISSYDGIEELAFKDTSIKSIIIEWKVGFTIGDNAFQNTVNLNSIKISSKYEENIGRYGFTSKQIENIQLINDNFFESSNFITIITISVSGLVLILAIISGVIISSKHHKRKEVIIDELRQKYEENEELID